ncbi:MAG: DUF2339 domain-containing protein [Alphaproteobacteria bacterium]|nr:MAG: DUF2339 domain-containing protein [Alphaproteobacteria bacterium]
MWLLLALLLILVLLWTPIAVIVLFTRVRDLRRDISRLEARLSAQSDIKVSEPEADTETPAFDNAPVAPAAEPVVSPKPATPPEPVDVQPPHVAQPKPSSSGASWIESLKAANWLILAGGIVLAFGVVFLVEYSIEEGLLGPVARVSLGALLGLALLVLGEFARHHSLGRLASVLKQDALPATLTGAGVLALFTSCYGAYALYELLPPMVAFALLAVIAFGALALSFWHGPIIASLGVAGAFAVPALITNTDSTALTLFSYLSVVAVTALLIARFKDWFWLCLVALLGAGSWQLFALGVMAFDSEIRPSALGFAAIMSLAFAGLLEPTARAYSPIRRPLRIDLVGGAAFAFFVFAIFQNRVPGLYEIILVALVVIGLTTLAHEIRHKFMLFPLAGIFALCCLASWRLNADAYSFFVGGYDRELGLAPMVPPAVMPLFIASGATFLFFALAGLARRTGPWAITATGFALLALINAYARIKGFDTSLSWGALGLGAAIVFLLAAQYLRKHSTDVAHDPALGAFAVGVLAALAFAATMTLEKAWLSVALAALLPAIAWVSLRIQVTLLRKVAFVLALVVFARLLLNPFALNYPIDPPLWINWMQYGYGMPALAFYFAARWFEETKKDLLTEVLKVGVLVFVLVLILSQVRLFIHDGDLRANRYLLSEAAVNTLTWLAFAYGLGRSRLIEGSPILLKTVQALYLLAAIHLVWMHVFVLNPLQTNDPVGTIMFIDVLTLAYLAPLIFITLMIAGPDRERIHAHLGLKEITPLSLAAYTLGLIYVSLEVRHFFHGTRLGEGAETDLELYTYSLIWVLYAAALMGAGIWTHSRPLRMAGLATIALATLKIFLFDMDKLEGLLRVFSFFGLAASLFGIGYLYQRFVVVPPQEKGGADTPPSSD